MPILNHLACSNFDVAFKIQIHDIQNAVEKMKKDTIKNIDTIIF
jgi:hypothetical protein